MVSAMVANTNLIHSQMLQAQKLQTMFMQSTHVTSVKHLGLKNLKTTDLFKGTCIKGKTTHAISMVKLHHACLNTKWVSCLASKVASGHKYAAGCMTILNTWEWIWVMVAWRYIKHKWIISLEAWNWTHAWRTWIISLEAWSWTHAPKRWIISLEAWSLTHASSRFQVPGMPSTFAAAAPQAQLTRCD